ncbi:hypothetical protein P4534_18300 [Peribacillus butanolivorans]|uniref:hypothetical protein n=1 Tax=Peribacillus butanolivorans TaxID=421767 RepID=UPI002E23516A|nr:hypothetical protein [Peribacillus butanolivorans]
MFTQQKEELENFYSIILSLCLIPNTELFEKINGLAPIVKQIGDCMGPRTLEEATHKGILTAISL